jgi:uncharacterized membrane protein (DUF485 family)
MNLLIATLFVLLGLMAAFRTDWMGKFKNERQKKLCRRCGIGVLVCGVVLLAFEFLGVGNH